MLGMKSPDNKKKSFVVYAQGWKRFCNAEHNMALYLTKNSFVFYGQGWKYSCNFEHEIT